MFYTNERAINKFLSRHWPMNDKDVVVYHAPYQKGEPSVQAYGFSFK
jgi:hypothetical protein